MRQISQEADLELGLHAMARDTRAWCFYHYDEPSANPERYAEEKRRLSRFCCLADFVPWQMPLCQSYAYTRSTLVFRSVMFSILFGFVQTIALISYSFLHQPNVLNVTNEGVALMVILIVFEISILFRAHDSHWQLRILIDTALWLVVTVYSIVVFIVSIGVGKSVYNLLYNEDPTKSISLSSVDPLLHIFMTCSTLTLMGFLSYQWNFLVAYCTKETRAVFEHVNVTIVNRQRGVDWTAHKLRMNGLELIRTQAQTPLRQDSMRSAVQVHYSEEDLDGQDMAETEVSRVSVRSDRMQDVALEHKRPQPSRKKNPIVDSNDDDEVDI